MYFEVPGCNLRVLGSLHAVPASSARMPWWVDEAYGWCERLVHEHDQSEVMRCTHADRPLREILRPATWDALCAALPDDAVRTAFNRLRPWAAMSRLPSTLVAPEPGVESLLLPRAAEDGKAVLSLESGEELRQTFDGVPLAVVEEAIERSLRDPLQLRRRLESLHGAWLSRNRSAVLTVTEASAIFEHPALREAGLLRRNRAWAPRVRRLMASPQRTLVVVGVSHLCGPGNLEECLGVTLVPVLASQ